MTPFTSSERHQLNEILNKPLGPEYLSYRSGSFGRLTYITGGVAVQLANEIFGFDGWSSEIKDTTIDYVDITNDNKVNVGVSVTMRITLKDGTYREDVGYGATENARNKGTGIEKAKKQATTDAIKRTLRNFGNALGNCMYEKSYLNGITQMGTPQIKFSPANLYRHEQFRPKDIPHPKPYTIPLQQQQLQERLQQQHAQAQAQAQQQQQEQQQRQQQQQQAESLAKKRHQEQIELQQKRAKQLHDEPQMAVKQEPVVNTSSTNITASKPQPPPLLPEESFSYEGDDEFYALFQEEFNGVGEDDFAVIDDAEIVELEKSQSQASNHSHFSTGAPESNTGARN